MNKSDQEKKKQKKSGKVGQPTKYKKEYCEGIVEFFKTYPRYEVKVEETYDKDGNVKSSKEVKKPLAPPTYYAYAAHINVCIDTLKDWTRAHPEFKTAYEKARAIQGQHIVENSMEGIAPTAFAIFMMKNNHGWTDKIESKVEQRTTLEGLISESFEDDE